MDDVQVNKQRHVELIEAGGEWFARVIDGDEELTRTFEIESFAWVFAEGHPRRLGLDRIIRI